MDLSARTDFFYPRAAPQDAAQTELIRSQPLPPHLGEKLQPLLVEPEVSQPGYHGIPAGEVPLGHSVEEIAGSPEVPVLDETAEEDVIGHDVPPRHCAEQGEGNLELPEFGVQVKEVVGSEAIVAGAGGDDEGMELLAMAEGEEAAGLEGVGEEVGICK